MKKEILIISLFVIVVFVVSGCDMIKSIEAQNSPKSLVNSAGEIGTPGLLKITGQGPFKCMYGITCRTNEGIEYSIPCERQGNQCFQRDCDEGDWWTSGRCEYTPLSSDSEVYNN